MKELNECLKGMEIRWEKACLRCGACCGAYDDPCLHLKKNSDNRFYCDIYPARLGLKRTLKGEVFKCVPIKELLDKNIHWKNDHYCAYKKK